MSLAAYAAEDIFVWNPSLFVTLWNLIDAVSDMMDEQQ